MNEIDELTAKRLEQILEIDPFEEGKTMPSWQRIHFFAQALAAGVALDRWSPSFRVDFDDREGNELWENIEGRGYKAKFEQYLIDIWSADRQHPKVSSLLAHDYMREYVNRPPRSGRTSQRHYHLTPRAMSLIEEPYTPIQVFISYRRETSPTQALMINQWLSSHGIENFFDIRSMDGGKVLDEEIEFAIKSRSHFICVLGGKDNSNTLKSSYVCKEIIWAMQHGKIALPFFQHDWEKPDMTTYKPEIQRFVEQHTGEPVAAPLKNNELAANYYDALMRLGLRLNISVR